MEGLKKLGDPYDYAVKYDEAGIDEILYMDIVASLYGRNALDDLVRRTVNDVFVPVCVGGGISGVEAARILFSAGADKICLNTGAIRNPKLITELAEKYGSQAVTIQIDAKQNGDGWECWCDGAREATGITASDWGAEVCDRGAGEILLTSVDQEGTQRGCDGHLIRALASLPIPVVASGGVGCGQHVAEAFDDGADGVAMAHVLHYETESLQSIRETVTAKGHEVRNELERN